MLPPINNYAYDRISFLLFCIWNDNFYITLVFLLILAPTIPKEDDVAVILEPEPSPRAPEESPATVRPVPTGKMSLPLCNEVSENPGTA